MFLDQNNKTTGIFCSNDFAMHITQVQIQVLVLPLLNNVYDNFLDYLLIFSMVNVNPVLYNRLF